MSEQHKQTLAEQANDARAELEEAIAELLTDFKARTGFDVEEITPYRHAPHGEEPYYAVGIKVKF